MSEPEDASELLFFDTFSHEVDSDINLDLVQFPMPVYITQIRIIPLGARVQADFPGGVRLGATNPSTFDIEFFVNDLGIQNAQTFENLGRMKYNQNDCIHLECGKNKITDGLVLRGWYSTITLAVYGITRTTLNEAIASPPPQLLEANASEDMCAEEISAESRIPGQPDEEWKEPLSNELTHKTRVSDYEREDMEYADGREHYHHHSGDERERRLRKFSPKHRTLSENNERDFLRSRSERERERDKSGREWSHSPDYLRRSRRKRSELSRSDAEDTHKWIPRTPPASIDSPSRPRSPDNVMEYADDDDAEQDMRYKLKARAYMRSRESLGEAAPVQETQNIDDDETPGTPVEQYEPILSDDEILGDEDSNAAADQAAADEFEAEIQAAADAAGTAIVKFDPYTHAILKYKGDIGVRYSKELENLRLIFKKFELQTKCNSLNAFMVTTTTSDERENFVFLSEQLINQLNYIIQHNKRRNLVLQQFFKNNTKNLHSAYNIFCVALDFDAANSQTQPAFKTRHIKIGARLTELLAGVDDFITYILQAQNFDPFAALFKLYQREYMALSIKLMLLKAVYALLDTKIGLEYFLGSEFNGYQLILQTLQKTHLTRTKYALQAIVKKLNLYEALDCIRQNCARLFVLFEAKELDHNSISTVEQAIDQVMDAISTNELSYQQPRRFLPVSKKFEIVMDASAQRSFENALQSFFAQQSLAESLLLILSNANELPISFVLRSLDLLKSLLSTNTGIDYLVDDCFETSTMLIALLLGLEDLTVREDKDKESEQQIKLEPKSEIKTEMDMDEENIVTTQNDVLLGKTDTETTNKNLQTASIEKINTESNPENIEKSVVTIKTDQVQGPPPILKHLKNRMQQLGIELAYKIQTRYHFDAIDFITATNDYDTMPLIDHLHAIYSQTCDTIGRQFIIEFMGLNNQLQTFMELIKKEQRLQEQQQHSNKYKSPVLMYTVDVIDCYVRHSDNLNYLIEHGSNLLELAKNHESFEPSVSAVLQEMYVYLKPLEAIHVFAYDDITPLVEVINRSVEYITTFPGDLIMGMRILRHLAIGANCGSMSNTHTEELKHRFVTLQFYAADGIQILLQILEKLCTYFEQPGLHKPALRSMQGLYCCQIILPTLEILRRMLSYAIQTRDVEFKDLIAIDHLMKTYFLLYHFPIDCAAMPLIDKAKFEIISLLLAYTQPHEQDEELLHKSLWTLMIREVLKNIDAPHTLLPGLRILAELLPLPLPLPLPNGMFLQADHTQRLITERKLWSAHLHPQSLQIARLIETVAPASFPQLTDLLVRVCLQLADLAPNMTLLISKTFSDLLCNEWNTAGSTPTQHLARLLHFFGRLTVHATLKSSALSILCGKLWELFQALLCLKEPTKIALKCQLGVHRIIESFLDTEISLVAPQSITAPEINLASALPPKEIIPRVAEAVLTNLFNVNVKHEVSALCVRNLVILTEHDITFYHLSSMLKQKTQDFQQWMQRTIECNETSGTYNTNIESLLVLLRSLTQIEENRNVDTTIPTRTHKLSAQELAQLIGFNKEANPHILQRIRDILPSNDTQNLNIAKHGLNDDIIKLITQLESIESHATSNATNNSINTIENDDDSTAQNIEPQLPQTESIVSQYVTRPVFAVYDPNDQNQLTTRYWLECISIDSYTAEDFTTQFERIRSDLNDLTNSCLSTDTNLTTDCKRVLHLCASPQSNRERTPTAPCFRTRRVEVEPTTGRPEKKLYITPVRGRGFSRAPPSRGDLFRSRPPNTSRPPSLHVDDFLALETCGAQPTGPTGYNKIPPILRGSRIRGNRGSRGIVAGVGYRKPKVLRTSSPSTWNDGSSPHYRSSNVGEAHFSSADLHYPSASTHFGMRSRGRGRARSYLR